jgi:hypothetical protein
VGLTPFAWLVLLALPPLLGALVLWLFGLTARADRLGFSAWSFTAGWLVLAVLELARLALGPVGLATTLGLALALALVLHARERAPVGPRALHDSRAARVFLGAALALVLVTLVVRAVAANQVPILRGDEALFWSKRAKLWFEAGGFGGVYAEWLAEERLNNGGHPFLNPLLQLFVFDLAGAVTHVANRIPLQLALLALVLATAAAVRRAGGAWIAGVAVLLVGASSAAGYAARHAGSDVLVALGAVIALDALQRAEDERRRAWLALAGAAAAVLVWAKDEGLLLLFAFATASLWCQRGGLGAFLRPRRTHLALLPALLALLVTLAHNAAFGKASSHAPWTSGVRGLVEGIGRDLAATLSAFAEGALALPDGQVALAVLLVALALPAARRGSGVRLALALALAWLGLLFVFVAKEKNPARALDNSLSRILLQLLPLHLLWLASAVRAARPAARRSLLRTPRDLRRAG